MTLYNRIELFLSSRPFKIGIMVIAIVTLAWCLGYYFLVLRPSQAELRSRQAEKFYLVPERNRSLASVSVPDIDGLPEVRQEHNGKDADEYSSHASPKWEWNTIDEASDSNHLIDDELDTKKMTAVQSNSDVLDDEIVHHSDALLDDVYDSLYIAKDTLDQILPALAEQLNALPPEEQRETLAEARLVMMDYLSPEAKKLLKEHPDLIDTGWNFLLAKLQDQGYELPE